MKTFKDLEFKPHPIGDGFQAILEFENGYGVSVIRFKCVSNISYASHTNNDDEWELAILKNGELCYNNSITDDIVLRYLKEDDVSSVMKQVQELKRD